MTSRTQSNASRTKGRTRTSRRSSSRSGTGADLGGVVRQAPLRGGVPGGVARRDPPFGPGVEAGREEPKGLAESLELRGSFRGRGTRDPPVPPYPEGDPVLEHLHE